MLGFSNFFKNPAPVFNNANLAAPREISIHYCRKDIKYDRIFKYYSVTLTKINFPVILAKQNVIKNMTTNLELIYS